MDVVSRRMRFRAELIGAALILISPIPFSGLAQPVQADEPRIALTDPADRSADDVQAGGLQAGSGAGEATTEHDGQQSDGEAPYVVFVAEPSAFARCGPGENHYRTEPLRRGQELEVYVETADGWLGIRPTEDSFCWMPADDVAIDQDEQSGTIREDKTVAWIGTQLGQARRYRWQVQLDAGEHVSIIGKTQREASSGTKTWLRIVPPSGEFRWIHRDQIAETAEQLAQLVASETSGAGQKPDIAMVALKGESKAQDDADAIPSLIPIRRAASDSDVANMRAEDVSRRGASTETLREATTVPELSAAPTAAGASRQDLSDGDSRTHSKLADRAIHFHRGARAEDFEDRGAVIGSGLRSDWQDDTQAPGSPTRDEAALVADGSASVLVDDQLAEPPTSGAAAAASAIAAPLRRMTDVVANFISPPRLVEIDSSGQNIFSSSTASDRRWMVGSARSADSRGPFSPPVSLASSQQESSADGPNQVIQTSATAGTALGRPVPTQGKPPRIVSVAAISRVEDAIAGANLETVSTVLSKLMAEGASADEMGPLVRRIEELMSSGDVNNATRTRELLDLAQRYRNVAARRDGATVIRSAALASNQPLVASPVERSPMQLDQTQLDQTQAMQTQTMQTETIETPLGPAIGTATGHLVQVYSSRANSPPFALTDDAGLTIAYVTPYPGVNLRNHLNSRIAVRGTEKLLEGLSTPHILVDRAVRR